MQLQKLEFGGSFLVLHYNTKLRMFGSGQMSPRKAFLPRERQPSKNTCICQVLSGTEPKSVGKRTNKAVYKVVNVECANKIRQDWRFQGWRLDRLDATPCDPDPLWHYRTTNFWQDGNADGLVRTKGSG